MFLTLPILLTACPGPSSTGGGTATTVTMHCLDDKEAFGAMARQSVLVDAAKVKSDLLAAAKENGKAIEVDTGNCDTKTGVDIMAREALASLYSANTRYREWETLSNRLSESRTMEFAFEVGAAATGVAPTRESVMRRDELRKLLGLDAVHFTGKGATVAVFDAGIASSNPAFSGALSAEEWCLGDGACNGGNACSGTGCGACAATNECQHGSATTSLIAGRTPSGADDAAETVGLYFAPDATAKVVRVLYQGEIGGKGSVNPRGDTARIARAIDKLLRDTTAADVPVVYLGFALDEATSDAMCGGRSGGLFSQAVQKLAKERIVVAPAGNEGAPSVAAPACFPGVVSVAASGRTQDAAHVDAPTVAAPWSGGGTTASMLAPGEDLPVAAPLDLQDGSTRAKSDYTWASGTSMAAASVAGAMALAVEAKGVEKMVAKGTAEKVACIADRTTTPPRLDLRQLASCP